MRLYPSGKIISYGPPTEAVLSRLRDEDVQVYRTDLQGDIIMISDGDNITVTTVKNEDIQNMKRKIISAIKTQRNFTVPIVIHFRQRKTVFNLKAARTL